MSALFDGESGIWVEPVGHRAGLTAACGKSEQPDLAMFPDATFVVRRDGYRVLGRGAFSPTPLYYRREADGTIARDAVSTRLRTIARLNQCQPDAAGVRDYLCYGFVPAPRTLLAGIGSLPPGVICTQNLVSGEECWQTIAPGGLPSESEAAELFWPSLCSSVAGSDASAVLLSGGIDSAAVALAAIEAGLQIRALHARFPVVQLERDDDTRAARTVAGHLKIPYEEIDIGPGQAARYFYQVVGAQDQATADPVVLPFYLLFRYLESAHKVVKKVKTPSPSQPTRKLGSSCTNLTI